MATKRFTLEDLSALIERVSPSSVLELHDNHVRVQCSGVSYEARVTGTDTGCGVASFTTVILSLEEFEDRFPLTKLLASVASTASVRVLIDDDRVLLQTSLVPGDVAPERLEPALEWRLSELLTVAVAWRRRLGLAHDSLPLRDVVTFAELIRTTPVPAQKALLVAAVGFAVAGADGRISSSEVARLRAWLTDVPSFAVLEQSRVVAAIATLVGDPARTLLEARRRLDTRERLLAWALANDMAHANGFTTADERNYLTSVASVFELSPADMEPFVADAQARALRREAPSVPPAPPGARRTTLTPPPH